MFCLQDVSAAPGCCCGAAAPKSDCWASMPCVGFGKVCTRKSHQQLCAVEESTVICDSQWAEERQSRDLAGGKHHRLTSERGRACVNRLPQDYLWCPNHPVFRDGQQLLGRVVKAEVWILQLPCQPCSPVVFPPLPPLRVCCVCRCKCNRDVCRVLKGLSPIQLHFGNLVCLRSGMGCVVWIVRSFLQLQLLWSTVVLRTVLYLRS